jgi:hypothetical protein
VTGAALSSGSATSASLRSNPANVSQTALTATSSSSGFLAQMLGQDSDRNMDTEIPQFVANQQLANAAEYNRLVAYSYVKYKPSDAGIEQTIR